MVKSYSQHGEDQILFEKYLKDIPTEMRLYMEIGAMDGIRYSNTHMLHEFFGWSGILVEPHPVNFDLLTKNRPNDILYNCVVSNRDEMVEYQYFDNQNLAAVSAIKDTLTPILIKNFFDPKTKNEWMREQQIKNLKKIMIKPQRLKDIVLNSKLQKISFFSLDVEGHEYEVLDSYDWQIEIEYIFVEENRDERVKKLLEEKGYLHVDKINNNNLFKLTNF